MLILGFLTMVLKIFDLIFSILPSIALPAIVYSTFLHAVTLVNTTIQIFPFLSLTWFIFVLTVSIELFILFARVFLASHTPVEDDY